MKVNNRIYIFVDGDLSIRLDTFMKTTVLLPTYNESENLKEMIPTVFSFLPKCQILVIDDNSPDGTGKLADQLSLKYPNQLFVLHRQKKEGLGKAYLAGFQEALKLNSDHIIQMDTDFSHPPTLLPEIDEALKKYDFVLGSRYISGGGTENWEWHRRLLSKAGNLYARLLLSSPIHDLTGGLKGFNRKVIEYLLQCPLDSSGYSFQIETTSYAIAAGYSYLEIPFIFAERRSGSSKMSKKIILEALKKTFPLRNKLKGFRK